ncbi:hypothetical protein CBR_g39080 [Chara braunii]|uniref:Alpha-MPP n=1 Tax=Chara braunii TaxID=69332 RepID=A0A388LQW3_CHABU|nr:hypothetical protein CBR_g39080 [Chara braunii]|eukprot:GBG84704.1 hypothetical protein CBR_g39080 [Chara braunii]
MLSTGVRRSLKAAPQWARLGQRGARTQAWAGSGGPLAQAIPAVSVSGDTHQSQEGGFFSKLFGLKKSGPVITPLFEPLPGLQTPSPVEFASIPLETKITTLPNGMKIASEDTPGPTTTVGLYIDSGSVYETAGNNGVSHLLERMSFKTTNNRTHFRLIREVEAIGGNVQASASREQMAYTGDALRTHMPEILELLADSVRNPKFVEWEVKEQLARVKAEVSEMANNPQSLMVEALHSAGYAGALGRPLLCPESNVGRLDSAACREFVEANYTAPRMVLAASGVDHSDLLAVAEPLFSDLPKVALPPTPLTEYVGGDWRLAADAPVTHVALGFEFPGGWRNEKDAVAISVLQMLMGGGGSFSAGGPGKGMYSRLYTRVLNQHGQVNSCTAFNSIYNSTGLFGIHGTAPSAFIASLVDIMCEEFLAVATPGGVTETELQRAKNATISHVLMNLESRVVTTEDIGRQILTYGHRKPPAEFCSMVEALSADDITAIAAKITKTPLSMASWGDVVHVPRFDQVAARFA